MKQFDPSVGWIQKPSPGEGAEGAQAPLPHPASVYHFNRQGNRLNVTRVEDGQEPRAATGPGAQDDVPPPVRRMREAAAAAAAAARDTLPAPAETASMVSELFERLDEADTAQPLLARVSENLKTLDDLAVKKGQLERVLADIAQEMEQLQAQVRQDLDDARDSEDRSLKLRQYRRELLEQLARRLPASGHRI